MPNQSQLKDWFRKRKERIQSLNAESILPELISGNRTALSTAITLVESQLSSDRKEANELIQRCLPHQKNRGELVSQVFQVLEKVHSLNLLAKLF